MSDVNNKLATVPAPIKAPLPALGGRPAAIVPQDFEAAYRMANVVVKAGMAPKSFDTTEKACVAILHGMEVGLTPMAALQSIAVVNGMPTIWGDGLLALIQGSGLLEDMEETQEVDEKGEWQWSICTMKRKGRATPVTRQFTRVMAMKAGLLTKAGPWTQYPTRMGQMRARSWCGRDAFPDVLRGLHNTEETMDMVDITDRGSATLAPAEPRRSDFRPPAQQQDEPQPGQVEPEGWPLHDETGETVGRFGTVEWVGKFLDAYDKLQGPECAQLLENNADTAKAIWEDDGTDDETAKRISAAYTPLAEAETVKDWKVDVIGEAPKMKAIKDLINQSAGTADEVDDILKQHAEFVGKLSAFKRDDINKTAAARKMALASLPA